jgi:hypothetical protein
MRNATVPTSVPSTWHSGTEELKLLLRARSVPPKLKSDCYQRESRLVLKFHYDGRIKAIRSFEDRANWEACFGLVLANSGFGIEFSNHSNEKSST